MTRDEILAMEPGRELDELVIRHIMNIPVVESVDLFSQEPFPAAWWVEDEGWYIAYERDEDGLIYMPFNPSEDIAAAFEVWEHDRPKKWNFDLCYSDGTYLAEIYKPDDVIGVRILAQVESKSAAEAMVKCRLLAVMEG